MRTSSTTSTLRAAAAYHKTDTRPEIDRLDEMSVVLQIAAENRRHKFSRINPPPGRRQLRLFLGLKSKFRWTRPGLDQVRVGPGQQGPARLSNILSSSSASRLPGFISDASGSAPDLRSNPQYLPVQCSAARCDAHKPDVLWIPGSYRPRPDSLLRPNYSQFRTTPAHPQMPARRPSWLLVLRRWKRRLPLPGSGASRDRALGSFQSP